MTKTMLVVVALMIGAGAIIALIGRVLKKIEIMADGVALMGAGALLFFYDIVALAF